MTDHLTAAVAELDEATVAAALERFVTLNPRYRGANWDDVIEILLDGDAHLELTEDTPDLASAIAAITDHYARVSHDGIHSTHG